MKKILLILFLLASYSSFALTCPSGYILVPPLAPYTSQEFCVMKYEAKADGNKKAISQASEKPWVHVNRATSISECQSLGPGYGLISNDQWQTIARNIAGVAINWSGNKVGSGELNRGSSDSASADGSISTGKPTPEADIKEPWHSQKRTHTLSNGNIIWDLAGNVAEWVSSDTLVERDYRRDVWPYDGKLQENQHVTFMNTGDIQQINYGPDPKTLCANPKKPPYCGMGLAAFPVTRDKSPGENLAEFCAVHWRKNVYRCGVGGSNVPLGQSYKAINRGGSDGYRTHNGIFNVSTNGPLGPTIGFRCVFVQ